MTRDRSTEFTLCRTLGHRWDYLNTTTSERADVTLVIRCTRCTMQRADEVHTDGTLERRSYKAPDGYREHGGKGGEPAGFTRTEWRARFIKSLR